MFLKTPFLERIKALQKEPVFILASDPKDPMTENEYFPKKDLLNVHFIYTANY